MKKFITSLLSLALVIGMCPAMLANAETVTLQGTGIETDPYLISSAAELKAARDMINANANGEATAYYEVTADIDLENEEWTPIGATGATAFSGHFDGKGHVVKNIKIEIADNDDYDNTYGTTAPALGFFGRVITAGTEVSNLGLENVTITNNAQFGSTTTQRKIAAIGGFVGVANNLSTFTNCYVKNANLAHNATTTPAGVGGFVGSYASSQTPTFINCYVYGATLHSSCTNGTDWIGGFASSRGTQYTKCSFENCYVADVTVTAATRENSDIYGFTGKGEKPTTAVNCYSELDDFDNAETTYTSNGAMGYDSTRTLGTVGMTKAGLVEAMTAVGYVTAATINDGYPCLAWEFPEDTLTGKGTVDEPYLIESASDLCDARDLINADTAGTGARSAYYKLTADIDLGNEEWIPIAPLSGAEFTGTFDGNKHVVRNVSITVTSTSIGEFSTSPAIGFFGRVSGTVKNLGIDTISVVNNAGYSNSTSYKNKLHSMAAFVGCVNAGNIDSCFVKNATLNYNISGMAASSGVSGFVSAITEISTISNCYVDGLTMISASKESSSNYQNLYAFSASNERSAASLTNCYVANATATLASSDASFYAFASSVTAPTKSNCFTTATAVQGTGYDASKAYGDQKTVREIADTLTALEGWKAGTGINESGAPALAWETAPVVVVADPYVVKSVSLAKGTVTLTVNNATTGDQVCIAAYDSNDRLVAAEFKDAAATVTTTVASSADVAKVKVFVWNGLTPVIDATVKTLY